MEACGAIAAACVCLMEKDHDGPHHCWDQVRCQGQWYGTEPNIRPVRFPLGAWVPGNEPIDVTE